MIDGKNRKGETPLMHARTADMATLLLSRGADPLAQDNNGFTALMHVVDAGAPEITPLLLAGSAAAHTPLTPEQINHTASSV